MKHSVQFEYRIRSEWLFVEAFALSDECGIYSVSVTGAFVDGVNVLGLLTEEDILELESAIEPAIDAEDKEDFDPARDAHRLGD